MRECFVTILCLVYLGELSTDMSLEQLLRRLPCSLIKRLFNYAQIFSKPLEIQQGRNMDKVG